jgi:hypothetical protein
VPVARDVRMPVSADHVRQRCLVCGVKRRAASRSSMDRLLRGLEIPRVRRRLVLARRHQVAVSGQEVVLLANHHVVVALGAVVLGPHYLAVRTPECRAYPRAPAAGVRKAPRHEIAVGEARRVPLYGDLASGGSFGERVILHR